ncbi:Uncharacterised protein [Mycobacteroides abscessus subsp. abscessus]|nr:Uncharacterised protein [Mycobacteroides abscessus subsp. abscessus]
MLSDCCPSSDFGAPRCVERVALGFPPFEFAALDFPACAVRGVESFDVEFLNVCSVPAGRARRLGAGESVSDWPRVMYQRPTPSASVTRKVNRIHGKSLAIGRRTLKIRLLRPDASSALRPYRVTTPTPNAISGGCATAVKSARLRTARTATTQPTR